MNSSISQYFSNQAKIIVFEVFENEHSNSFVREFPNAVLSRFRFADVLNESAPSAVMRPAGVHTIDLLHLDRLSNDIEIANKTAKILRYFKMIVRTPGPIRSGDLYSYLARYGFEKLIPNGDHEIFVNTRYLQPNTTKLGPFSRLIRRNQRNRKDQKESKFRKHSFSQCGEDIIVQYIFDIIGILKPTYLDIGAHHPYYMNNTYLLYKNGGRGVNVEPDPDLFKMFLSERPDDVNVNIGISDQESIADFYRMSTPTLNTFSAEDARRASNAGYPIVEVKKLKTLPLRSIIDQHCNGIFPDFLSIDAEGFDEKVIADIRKEKTKPIVICTETLTFDDPGKGAKNEVIPKILADLGYIQFADTNINSIFVLKDKWAP